ncbi:site-2 protease family protein [Ruminococcaceae bacterium OttesenSCG-928-I18]|nr:site-2 protease family protein [Ruminococcaceae bacterium OttesenSCG-928-I18]
MFGFFDGGLLIIVARILAFATAIPFHEAAHAYVSDKLGDHTARQLGRLTLNPIKHLDPFGLLAMLIIGIGWAKPVPINVEAYKNKKVGMAITAAAGPLSNLLLAYVSILVYKLSAYGWVAYAGAADPNVVMDAIITIFYYLAVININLAVFNMLPIPPFDGSRIFGLVLPESLYFKVMKYERFIMFGVLILLWVGLLSKPLMTLNGWVISGMDWATGYVDLIFKAVLGG